MPAPHGAASNRWLDRIATEDGIDTLVHVGAGPGDGLPEGGGFLRAVLVEPDPGHAPALRARARADARIRVEEVALAEAPGVAVLTLFNVDALASLCEAGPGLGMLFPGLRVTDRVVVTARALPDLVGELDLRAGDDNVLVLDAPGLGAGLLGQLLGAGQARHFRDVILRGAADARFEGGQPLGEWIPALLAAGFGKADLSETDPDFPEYRFRRVPAEPRGPDAAPGPGDPEEEARRTIAGLEAELAALRKAGAQERRVRRLQEERLETLRLRLAELQAENRGLRARLGADTADAALTDGGRR